MSTEIDIEFSVTSESAPSNGYGPSQLGTYGPSQLGTYGPSQLGTYGPSQV